jgi:hypothetical protein
MSETDCRKACDENPARLLADTAKIQAQLAQVPVLDDRSPEEIIGYDGSGLPV